MASNLIQIKRSATNAVIPTLSPGEMAFTQAGNTLFIGAPDNSSGNIRIGGQMVPGTLTANQALVANSTSGIDRVKTANLEVNLILAGGSNYGTAGEVLASNGTSNVYWTSIASLGVNEAAQYAWTNTQSFSNTITFNGSVLANSVNATSVNSSSYSAGAPDAGTGGVYSNATTIIVGNNTVNSVLTSAGLNVNGASIVNNSGFYTTGTVNTSSLSTGTPGAGSGGVYANVTTIIVGNNTINTVITSAGLNVNGSAVVANNTGVYTTGTVNTSTFSTGGGTGSASGGVSVNTTFISVGNNSVNGSITTNSTAAYFTGTAYTANNALNLGGVSAATLSGYAAAAYSNAMADTLSRNGSYTGNNVIGGTNTVFNSNVVFTGNSISSTFANALVSIGSFGVNISANLVSPGSGTNHGAAIHIGDPGLNGPGGRREYATLGSGSFMTSANVNFANSSLIQVGNNSTWANLNNGTLYLNGGGVSATVNSTTYSGTVLNANNASYLGTVAASNYIQTSSSVTLSGNLYFTGSNNVFGDATTDLISFNGTIANNFIPSSNNTYTLGNTTNRWSALYVSGNTIYIGNSSISVDSSNNITFGGSNGIVVNTATVNTISGVSSSNLNITSNTVFSSAVANIDATAATLRVAEITTGNLTVTGTLTTIDSVNIQVKDATVKLADAQSNTASYVDSLDFGIYGTYGNNSSNTNYSGIYRDHNSSNSSYAVWKVFASKTQPTDVIDRSGAGYNLGSLQAYLQPYGPTGAFVANSTSVNITANSTFSVGITANSVSFTSALPATSGGTGVNTYATGDLLYSGSTNPSALTKLTIGSSGYVLQSNSIGLPQWATLDGGSF